MKKKMKPAADGKTHWKQLMNPEFLGAYSLPSGQDLVVTIACVDNREIVGAQGKKEILTVATMVNEKPMILNTTNCKSLAKLFGNHIEDWADKSITLFASTTKFGGEIVECLRIKPEAVVLAKPSLTDQRLEAAIVQIQAGKYSIEKLTSGYQLSPAQLNRLTESHHA